MGNCETCNVELTDETKCTCMEGATHCKNHHPEGEASSEAS